MADDLISGRHWRPARLWLLLKAAMGGRPTSLAASGGGLGTLPTALAASGGGNGGRHSSGRLWKPTLTLRLSVEAARALYLPALHASGGGYFG